MRKPWVKVQENMASPGGGGTNFFSPAQIDRSKCGRRCQNQQQASPRQGRLIVARYVSEGTLRAAEGSGRSGIYPRLSEAKGGYAREKDSVLAAAGLRAAHAERVHKCAGGANARFS